MKNNYNKTGSYINHIKLPFHFLSFNNDHDTQEKTGRRYN